MPDRSRFEGLNYVPTIQAVPLASGSKGNCLFLEAGGVRLLVDAGISCRQIQMRLHSIDVELSSIQALLITHEHSDHIAAIWQFAKRFQTPVYTTQATADYLRTRVFPDKDVDWRTVEAGQKVRLGDELDVRPFSISHDAADPVGFRFDCRGASLAVAADLGVVTRLVCDRLSGCQALLCESNHDPLMLKNGPYPVYLKRRIAGKFGHLSNTDCRKLIENVYHDDLATIVLTHLSEKNNTPNLAYENIKAFLDQIGARADLRVALQDKVGTPITIG